MPNHVYSTITAYGSEPDIIKIKKELKGKEKDQHLSFENIIPVPKHIFQGNLGQKEKEKYGRNNWFDWNCDNWGTKWNAYSQPEDDPKIFGEANSLKFIKDKENTPAVITYNFCTAWSPVPKILESLSEKYPSCIFKYAFLDEGGGFSGIEFWHNGVLVKEKELRPKNQVFNYDQDIPKLMREFKGLKIKIP